jgi:hypothetical protein
MFASAMCSSRASCRLGLLDGLQVGPDDVLGELLDEPLRLGQLALLDDARDRLEPGHLGGPEPTLAGDDDVHGQLLVVADSDRLEDAEALDALDQLLERRLVEDLPRLARVASEPLDRDLIGAPESLEPLIPGSLHGGAPGRGG